MRHAFVLLIYVYAFLIYPTATYTQEKQSFSTKSDTCQRDVRIIDPQPAPIPELELSSKADRKKKRIAIDFQDEDLVTVINRLAAQKGVNIILPQGPAAIKAKVTFRLKNKLTIDEAWDILHTILDVAGYLLVPKKHFYTIVKSSKEATREPTPIYIATPPALLPDTPEVITYIYYLSNNKVTADSAGELQPILQNYLPEGSLFRTEVSSNAIILKAPSYAIKMLVQHIIMLLDEADFRETLHRIDLQFTSAQMIADLFNKGILPASGATEQLTPGRFRLEPARQLSDSAYFSRSVRIIPEPRRNSLIILGRKQAVDRITSFIKEYLDKEPLVGKPLFHVYKLRYLDATDVQKVLTNIIEASSQVRATSETGQATTEALPQIGSERFFGPVKILTDKPEAETAGAAAASAGYAGYSYTGVGGALEGEEVPYQGSNSLIVVAGHDDWEQIKNFIQRIDQPQSQVLLEILIADLTVEDTRRLGSMLRNPERFPFPNGVGFQAAHLAPGIIPDSFDNPTTIGVMTQPQYTAADLLRRFDVGSDGIRTDGDGASAASSVEPGTAMISFNDNDGRTWGILQILKTFDHTKVLSHPHVIATHNQPVEIVFGETRRSRGAGILDVNNPTIQIEDIIATTSINITPRISTAEVVNMQVSIGIVDFRGGEETRVNRSVITNATVHDGDILALGGFVRTSDLNSANETPLLSRIPIIGWFFKSRDTELQKTNLTVFISPTILHPRLRKGIGRYTKDYMKSIKKDVEVGSFFGSLRDPITRWFFNSGGTSAEQLGEEFIAKDAYAGREDVLPDIEVFKDHDVSTISVAQNSIHNRPSENNVHTIQPLTDKDQVVTTNIKQLVDADPNRIFTRRPRSAKGAYPRS